MITIKIEMMFLKIVMAGKTLKTLSSLDIEQFNMDMLNLLKYQPVDTPLYDMATGLRKVESKKNFNWKIILY